VILFVNELKYFSEIVFRLNINKRRSSMNYFPWLPVVIALLEIVKNQMED